jgi:DNA-binding transcriptional MerR regulator
MPGGALILHPTIGRDLTLDALATAAGLHPALVERFVAYGLLDPVNSDERVARFNVPALRRLLTICRLRDDLGINLAGVAVVLDLLGQIEELRRELAASRRSSREGSDESWT